jgi:integrase
LERDGHRLARDLPRDKARKIIQEIGERRPGMANLTKKVLRRLFAYAIDVGLRQDNPFDRAPTYKLGTHHTWTEAELAAFESRWPLGTRERLAYALLLYTGQRGGDVVRMQRSDIRNGAIHVIQEKTGTELYVKLHPALVRTIKAGPAKGLYLVGEERSGRPITRDGLTHLMKRAALPGGAATAMPSPRAAQGRAAPSRRVWIDLKADPGRIGPPQPFGG